LSRKETIRQAVAELRRRLEVDQTAFARMLGKSYPMARRYETDVPPQGEALAPFALLAIERGYQDLATVFRDALIQDMPEVAKVLSDSSLPHQRLDIPRSMLPVVEWILELFARRGTPEQEVLKDTLRMLTAQRSKELKGARLKTKNVSPQHC